jgi:hypothetical protein
LVWGGSKEGGGRLPKRFFVVGENTQIQDGVCEVAERGWFEEGVERRLGNGKETLGMSTG